MLPVNLLRSLHAILSGYQKLASKKIFLIFNKLIYIVNITNTSREFENGLFQNVFTDMANILNTLHSHRVANS